MKKPISSIYEGKNIAVLGGTGSIGSKIVEKILEYDPKVVRVLDINEEALFFLQQRFSKSDNLRFLIGDIRDEKRLNSALKGIDIVFLAAALKHVSSCEFNPFEAVKTNVIGTQNVINQSMENNVEKAIFISTDKAVVPNNVMGATKLLGEKIFTAAEYFKGDRQTTFSTVRFGNVLGSSGSVVPIIKRNLMQGEPVYITDPKMTRFVMTTSQAVELVLNATTYTVGGEIFILKMFAVNVMDLITSIIEYYAPIYNVDPNTVNIIETGPRLGEKVHEDLMNQDEAQIALENEKFFIIPVVHHFSNEIFQRDTPLSLGELYPKFKKAEIKSFSSNESSLLTKDQLKDMIKQTDIDRNLPI